MICTIIMDFFKKIISFVPPRRRFQSVASKLDSSDWDRKMEEGLSGVDLKFDPDVVSFVLEFGPTICKTVEECRATLSTVGTNKITPAAVARIMSGMIQASEKLGDKQGHGEYEEMGSWNGKVFVQAVLDLVPHFIWKEVFHQLDFPGFHLKTSTSFRSLIEALRYGLTLQGQTRPDQFPVEAFYRLWNNTEGQLSLLKFCLNPHNFDIFCFADLPYHPCSVDILKSSSDKMSELKEISIWKSLELNEVLLRLSDSGHYSAIHDLYSYPSQNCPDILLISLIQLSSPMNLLRQELLTKLFPIFLNNHPSSGVILQFAWSQNLQGSIRPLLILAMADWYLRSDYDQAKLSRILDIAQDLKALQLLLNASSHAFIIDLACMASRREFLKLDKWLGDKVREYEESFLSSLVKTLTRRVPMLLGKDDGSGHNKGSLPPEVVGIIVNTLCQGIGKNTNPELVDTIMTLSKSYQMLMVNGPRSGGVNVLQRHRSMEPSFNLSSPPPPLSNLYPPPEPPNMQQVLSAGLGNYGPGPTPGSPSRVYPFHNPMGVGGSGGGSNVLNNVLSRPSPSTPPMLGMLGGGGGGRFGSGGGAPPLQPPLPHPRGFDTSSLPTPTPLSSNTSGIPYSGEGGGGGGGGLFNEGQGGGISKEAEDEANTYFHKIYSKPPDPTMSIDEVLDMLKRFQDSSIRRERDVFNCMLRNLFDEYKFFPQYPEKELHITAQLFGGIIEHNLVSSYMQLGVALRFVVDALKKPPGAKMYFFGISALERFKHKLKDYPQYCQHLTTIQHFHDFPPSLVEFVEYGASQRDPPGTSSLMNSSSSGSGGGGGGLSSRGPASLPPAPIHNSSSSNPQPPPSLTNSVAPKPIGNSIVKSGRPSLANATNINTLLIALENDTEIVEPPEIIQDKTAFIFNNLNQMNLQDKCRELRELLGGDHWKWMSQYLVLKRASIELNFHTLYSNLLDTIRVKELNGFVIKETHKNIRILLRTDKSASNFSDRSLLKNLGHWLGMITLMKNRPIILDDLDIKSLIVEAYRKGISDLLYIVPFASKIIESCGRSLIFKPPCPWTMAILGVLAEIHKEPEMKLNLKFEIEVLCKALNIEVSAIKPTNILREEEGFRILVRQLPKGSSVSGEGTTVREVINQSKQSSKAATPQPDEFNSNLVSTPPPSGLQQTIGGGLLSGLASLQGGTPSEPKFSFMEIDTGNLGALLGHVSINSSIPLLQAHSSLKRFIKGAIEKAVSELLAPVVERSIKYTINACEAVVKKDFALDPEENRMRAGAHQMMRHLTAGMAMITSRDHIFIAITTNLRSVFSANVRNAATSQQIKDMIEQAVTVIAQENMELACVFIQKTAVEKSLIEIDKRLATEYEVRKQARLEGRRYCDPQMLNYQLERIPESIRVKPGGVSQQLAVYEDFSRNIPGFLPTTDSEVHFMNPAKVMLQMQRDQGTMGPPAALPPPGANDELLLIYEKLIGQMENYLQDLSHSPSPVSPHFSNGIRVIAEAIHTAKQSRSVVAAITLLQKAVEGLLEGLANFGGDSEIIRFRDAHLLVLKALQDQRAFGEQWVNRQVTKTLIETRTDFQFNVEAVDTLIRSNLVNMLQFDAYLANALEKGNNIEAMNFAIQLVRMYCIDDRFSVPIIEGDFFHTADILCRCATMNRHHPEGLLALVELLRGNNGQGQQQVLPSQPPPQNIVIEQPPPVFIPPTVPTPTPTVTSLLHNMQSNPEFGDPSGLVEKSELLLREWIRLFLTQGTPNDSSKPFASFINELNASGILKSDDVITRFFRISVQCCVNQVYQGLQSGSFPMVRGKVYQSTDALVRLVSLLIKHIGDSGNPVHKINLLNKFLGILAGLLIQDHDMQKAEFQQLPFHRMFIMLFYDMIGTDPIFENIAMQTLSGFSNTLHILNPIKVPGFAYAWLEIVGNRMFVARMLALAADQKCWAMYCQLLLDLFKFLQPFMRNADMAAPVQTLYRGTLRVLLVILHDFPDFLCDYCYHFLDAIPPNCIQMRNLVLSAFPRNMRLPDPFTANLKFEMLADTALPPRILSNVGGMITPAVFKKDLDSYLKTRAPVTFLSELRTNLQAQQYNELGNRYSIPLLNALVLYVGSQHISVIRARGQTPSLSTVAHTSHMDIFQNLAVDLDTEGRYLFLNALANQLRFPSSHTHYFSLIILYLFAESNTEVVQEQITRVLLERLVVNRPHPWGLLVTFIELIKNPAYKFWTHEFVHCAPEVEKLFESVARSCQVTKGVTSTPSATPIPTGGGGGPISNGPSNLLSYVPPSPPPPETPTQGHEND